MQVLSYSAMQKTNAGEEDKRTVGAGPEGRWKSRITLRIYINLPCVTSYPRSFFQCRCIENHSIVASVEMKNWSQSFTAVYHCLHYQQTEVTTPTTCTRTRSESLNSSTWSEPHLYPPPLSASLMCQRPDMQRLDEWPRDAAASYDSAVSLRTVIPHRRDEALPDLFLCQCHSNTWRMTRPKGSTSLSHDCGRLVGNSKMQT